MKKILLTLFGLVALNLAGRFNEKLLRNDEEVETAGKVSDSVKKAAGALFTPTNDIFIIVPTRSNNPDVVQKILRETFANRTVKVSTKFPRESKGESRILARDSSFVLIGDDGDIRQLMEDSSVGRWREYIIVIDATFQWLSEFADRLWNLGFVRVAYVRMASNGSSTFLRPIQSSSARGSKPSLTAFDLCKKNQALAMSSPETSTVHPFSSMLQTPTNGTLKFARLMEGTQVKTDYSKGIEENARTSFGTAVLMLFAIKYNIELVQYTEKDEDTSTWSDARNQCLAGEFDFFYDRELPHEENCCEEVEPMAWYIYETLVSIDSLKSSFYPLQRLFVTFQGLVWLFTLVLLGIFALFAYTTEKLWRQGLVRERMTAFQIWSVFMGQSLSVVPVKFGLRFVLGMWIVFSVNNYLLYAGTFSSALTDNDHSHILKTFRDILDSGRPICGSNKTKKLLNDARNPVMQSLHERLEPIISTAIIGKILNDNYIGTRHIRHVINHNWINRANDSLRLYIIPEATIVNYPSCYFAKKHHPYTKDFARMVSMIRDSGIFDYLIQRRTKILEKTRAETALAETHESLLLMKHLQVVFEILIIGHLIAGLVFLIELWIPRKFVKLCGPPN